MVRTVLLTALAPAAWGTTYLVTTELMPADRPLLTAAVRTLPVGILLSVAARQRPTGPWWWRTAVLGALNIGVFQALLFVAAYRLPGGVAATVGGVQPLVVAALASRLLGDPFRLRTALTGLGGILGLSLLVLTPQATLDAPGIVAALAGTVSMATGVVLTKRWGRPVGLMTVTGWQLTAGGLLLAPLAFALEGPPPTWTGNNWVGAAWLAVAGTGVAYGLWFRGIDHLPVTAISFLGLMSPVVATALGWAVLDQSLTAGQLVGAALIAATVIAAQIGASPSEPPPVRPSPPALPTPTTRKEQAHAY
jgi:probable blue pigment (indigoidine) exporter